jgi:putative redox protein
VRAHWAGGLRADVRAGEFDVVADKPVTVPGGTGSGPQPTELLLASIASCFTLSLANAANKRGIALSGVTVDVTGHHNGRRFDSFAVTVNAEEPQGEELDRLVELAERNCDVTKTIAAAPAVTVAAAAARS